MAVRKSHIDYSLKGEQPQQNDAHLIETKIALENEVKPNQEFVIYKLVSNARRGRVRIDGIDDVINPKTGKPERMMLLSGIDTIWYSEIKKMNLTEDYIKQNRRNIVFDSRLAFVPKWDTTAIEFLETSRHFIENPNRKSGSKFEFFKYDPQKQQKAALDKELLELEMAMKVRDMPEEQVKRMATFMGVGFNDELGRPKTPSGIRQELMLKAKRSPEYFRDHLDSKEVDVSYMVKAAILDGKIDLGKQPNSAYYATGGLICKIPHGKKPHEYLTEFAMSTLEDGKQFLERLQSISN